MSLRTLRPCLTNFVKLTKTCRYVFHRFNNVQNITKRSHQVLWFATDQKIHSQKVEEVYYGALAPQVKAVKLFSLTTSLIGLIAQPFFYEAFTTRADTGMLIFAYTFMGLYTFVTPFLLNLITKKYIIQMTYKPGTDTYVGRTLTFFCFPREVEFKVGDVKVPEIPGMFTTLRVKGKPYFLDPRFFDNTYHYAKLMGYDKPMDFKMSTDNDNNNRSYKSPRDEK